MRRSFLPALLSVLVLLPALAACGGGSSAAKPGGGPPKGGWPTPVNGKLTAAMCGLLTDDDYQKYGHTRLGQIGAKRLDTGPNVVACQYQGDDGLTLNLQRGTVPAHLVYRLDAARHADARGKGAAAPLTNVVPGADESWFDVAGDNVAAGNRAYELEFRRGSLVTTLELGWLKGNDEKEPQRILTGLATLVMRRTKVGTSGPDITPTLTYKVRGHGRAELLSYLRPDTAETVEKHNVKLPWSASFPIPELGSAQPPLQLNATAKRPPGAFVLPGMSCAITLDGRQVVSNDGMGTASCLGSL